MLSATGSQPASDLSADPRVAGQAQPTTDQGKSWQEQAGDIYAAANAMLDSGGLLGLPTVPNLPTPPISARDVLNPNTASSTIQNSLPSLSQEQAKALVSVSARAFDTLGQAWDSISGGAGTNPYSGFSASLQNLLGSYGTAANPQYDASQNPSFGSSSNQQSVCGVANTPPPVKPNVAPGQTGGQGNPGGNTSGQEPAKSPTGNTSPASQEPVKNPQGASQEPGKPPGPAPANTSPVADEFQSYLDGLKSNYAPPVPRPDAVSPVDQATPGKPLVPPDAVSGTPTPSGPVEIQTGNASQTIMVDGSQTTGPASVPRTIDPTQGTGALNLTGQGGPFFIQDAANANYTVLGADGKVLHQGGEGGRVLQLGQDAQVFLRGADGSLKMLQGGTGGPGGVGSPEGKDGLVVQAAAGAETRLQAGQGNDTIVVKPGEGSGPITIDGGGGKDTVLIQGGEGQNYTLVDASGRVLHQAGEGGSRIQVADGNSKIYVQGADGQLQEIQRPDPTQGNDAIPRPGTMSGVPGQPPEGGSSILPPDGQSKGVGGVEAGAAGGQDKGTGQGAAQNQGATGEGG
ncbi:MAG: hypothetical protein AB1758_32070, partial [Candidatus Eremiobacterota bacterium]